jgi:type VI secretion system secreted protein VgrG
MSIVRRLTPGEIKLARSVFGDSIEYKNVHISNKSIPFVQPENAAMTLMSDILMHNHYREDYSTAPAQARGLFIHEMTHVWQAQNKVKLPVTAALGLQLKNRFNYQAAYPFLLDKKKDLTDYNLEQQASILQEYYLATRAHMPSYKKNCENACSNRERKALYAEVLKKFLQNPSYARNNKFPLFRI